MNRLKELRHERGLSIRQFANIMGISFSTVASYEAERRDLNTDLLKKYADFFEVSIDYLLMYKDETIYCHYKTKNQTYSFTLDKETYDKIYKFMYFEDNHRYFDLHEYLGIGNDNDVFALIEDFSIYEQLKQDYVSSHKIALTLPVINRLRHIIHSQELTK